MRPVLMTNWQKGKHWAWHLAALALKQRSLIFLVFLWYCKFFPTSWLIPRLFATVGQATAHGKAAPSTAGMAPSNILALPVGILWGSCGDPVGILWGCGVACLCVRCTSWAIGHVSKFKVHRHNRSFLGMKHHENSWSAFEIIMEWLNLWQYP